ncbi:MAG TPA: hypothetical protein VG497_30600 [Kribbella sp.]|nr:hypothetical protein [Kribbella sp.]
MGIFGSFSKASKVVADAKKDIDRGRKNRPKDEVADRRQQKQQGGGKK